MKSIGDKEHSLREKKDEFYNKAYPDYSDYISQADIDSKFEAGDQNAILNYHREIPNSTRTFFSFNRIRPSINMISGRQRDTRSSLKVVPVENADQKTADQYSKVLSHVTRRDLMFNTESEAFQTSLISGMSLMSLWLDYSEDHSSGNIRLDSSHPDSFLIDPFTKKMDLSDCSGILKRTYMTEEQVSTLWPGNKGDIKQLVKKGMDDNKFISMPERFTLHQKGDLLAYDEYYYMTSRKKKILVDRNSREALDIDSDGMSKEEIGMYLDLFPDIDLVVNIIPTVKLAIFANDTLIYDGNNFLDIDEYPIVPVFAYFRPNLSSMALRVQGVVRGLRDPQYLFNRRKVINDNIISSRLTNPIYYKNGAIVNPDDLLMTGEGKTVAIADGFELSDIREGQPPQIPPSYFQVASEYEKDIQAISGVNEELLGSATDDKAGVLAAARQGAGLITLRPLFDNLDYAKKILGRRLLKGIQKNFSAEKVSEIINEEPTDKFYNKSFGIYDAVVTNGFDTDQQRTQELYDLLNLKDRGINIPDSNIISAANIQNKEDLLQTIQQQEQAAMQQGQEQSATEQELVKAQTEMAKAKVELDLSRAKEADSKVFYNMGSMQERQYEAEKDKTQAMLNFVKTLQELDSVDINEIIKYIEVKSSMEKISTPEDKTPIASAIIGNVSRDVPEVPDRTVPNQGGMENV